MSTATTPNAVSPTASLNLFDLEQPANKARTEGKVFHDPLAEEGIIATVMLVPERLTDVLEELDVKDFFVENCKIVFQALVELYAEKPERKRIDSITLMGKLREMKRLGSGDGLVNPSFVTTLANHPHASVEHLEAYIEIVKTHSLRRQMFGELKGEQKKFLEPGVNPYDEAGGLLRRIQTHLERFTAKNKNKSYRNDEDGAEKYLERLNARSGKDHDKEDRKMLTFGLRGFDGDEVSKSRPMVMLKRGFTVVLQGHTGTGKSMWMVHLVRTNLKRGMKIRVYMNETDFDFTEDRFISGIAHVDYERIMLHREYGNVLTQDEQSAITWAAKEWASWKQSGGRLDLVACSGWDGVMIAADMRKWQETEIARTGRGYDAMFVDYLHRMSSPYPGIPDEDHRAIAGNMKRLSDLAQPLDIVVFIFSQITVSQKAKDEANGGRVKAGLGDAKGSREIDNRAQYVLSIWMSDDKKEATITVVKANAGRDGQDVMVSARCIPNECRFEEKDW